VSRLVAALLALATVVGVRAAHADGGPACLASYEQAQVLRKRHELRAAREAAIACAAHECPTALARECATWIGEIEQTLPSVVFVATAGGVEVSDVKVSENGRPLVAALDGSATFVDPGPRRFRFERAGRAVDLAIVVREGEKNRRVDVDFGAGERRVPAVAWAFGGVAVAAAIAGAFFELRGLHDKRELDDARCKPACDPAAVDRMSHDLVTGDLLLVGAGVAAAAAITAVLTARPAALEPRAPGVSIVTWPRAGGATVGLRGSF
jgi:hypothetical protein